MQEESGAATPQEGAPSASAPRIAPVITDDDEEDSDTDADAPFGIADLVAVIDPAALETLMDGCGERAPAWAKLRKSLPMGKGKPSFLRFTGALRRDIEAAKIADLTNKLGVDEALSGAATIATYVLGGLLYDPRLAELDDGPAGTSMDLLRLLICALLQERGKQRAIINKSIAKSVPGYQLLVDMAEDDDKEGTDCLTAGQLQQYVQYKNDSRLADAIGKAKPATAPQSAGFQKGGYKGKFTPSYNNNGKSDNNSWKKKPFPADKAYKPDQQQQQQQSK
ncbi:hypothetical protein FBU31_000098 [Coemansia sp. 'formosensis']|nr:hypothetical protein FBU31_000098 [Coemansia sp. 'formosensis']